MMYPSQAVRRPETGGYRRSRKHSCERLEVGNSLSTAEAAHPVPVFAR
jgi:hypothetical protein